MCFAIEPITNAGTYDVDISDLNGWIVRTKDGKPSVQWEVKTATSFCSGRKLA